MKSTASFPSYYFEGHKKVKLIMEIDTSFQKNFKVEAFFNDVSIGTRDKPANSLETYIDLTKIKINTLNELSIKSNTFIPNKIDKKSPDTRELGIRIKKLY